MDSESNSIQEFYKFVLMTTIFCIYKKNDANGVSQFSRVKKISDYFLFGNEQFACRHLFILKDIFFHD